MKLTRKQIGACDTKEELIELHQRCNPGANMGTSITFAERVLEGRKNRVKKVKETKSWTDIY